METESKKIFFVTGGGTGGHIYPALATAKVLTDDGYKVYYVGNKRNMEYDLATKNGYEFLNVNVSGMPRKLSFKIFMWLFNLVIAIFYTIKYLKDYKPQAVFATGGYVSAPLVFACIITKTPYMMHDCDAMPGLVSRKLSKYANCVSLAFEKAKEYIPNKNIVVTGNPIREQFKTMTKQDAINEFGLQNKTTLCVMGGSQGAKSINNATVEVLRELSERFDLQVIFQTGRKNYEDVTTRLALIYPNYDKDSNIIIRPYFDNMIAVLKASDIVVARAGSLSLSEICASDVAPILIPYPYAASNHQRLNAKILLEKGACIYVEDSEFEPNKLINIISELINNPTKINYLKQNSLSLAKYNAAEQIKDIVENLG